MHPTKYFQNMLKYINNAKAIGFGKMITSSDSSNVYIYIKACHMPKIGWHTCERVMEEKWVDGSLGWKY